MKARVILSACNSAAILSRSPKMKSAKEMDHLEAEPVLVSVQESVCTAYSIDPRDRRVVPNVGPAQHCC